MATLLVLLIAAMAVGYLWRTVAGSLKQEAPPCGCGGCQGCPAAGYNCLQKTDAKIVSARHAINHRPRLQMPSDKRQWTSPPPSKPPMEPLDLNISRKR